MLRMLDTGPRVRTKRALTAFSKDIKARSSSMKCQSRAMATLRSLSTSNLTLGESLSSAMLETVVDA